MNLKKKLSKLVLGGLVLGMLSCGNVANAENVLDAINGLLDPNAQAPLITSSMVNEKHHNINFINTNMDSMEIPSYTDKGFVADDIYREGVNALQNENYPEAYLNLKMASDAGHPIAPYHLGWMYYYGRGVKQNYYDAREYFGLSAKRGYPLGKYEYAEGLLQGVNRRYNIYANTCNKPEGLKWLARAAKDGVVEAYFAFGLIYANGWDGLSQNKERAMQFFMKARSSNTGYGYYAYGYMYAHDVIGRYDTNDENATKWFLKAIDMGYSNEYMQNHLVRYYKSKGMNDYASYYEGNLPKEVLGYVKLY